VIYDSFRNHWDFEVASRFRWEKEKWRILPIDEVHDQPVAAHELEPVSLSELIHQHIRVVVETAVHEELRAVLGTSLQPRRRERIDCDRSALSAANVGGQ